MPPEFWFLVGVAASLGGMLAISAIRRRSSPQPVPVAVAEPVVHGGDRARGDPAGGDPARGDPARGDPARGDPARGDRAELRLSQHLLDDARRDLGSIALSLGQEIATLASSIECHAQLLSESINEPRLVASRSERLWLSVRRLRLFSEKILSFARVETLPVRPIDVRRFLLDLKKELEGASGQISVEVTTADFLPQAMGCQRALRNAAVFLVETLLQLETRANRVHLRACVTFSEDREARVAIEISAEAEESGPPHGKPRPAEQLGYVAARNLLEAQSAEVSFDEVQGLSVACLIALPAAIPDHLEDSPTALGFEPRGGFEDSGLEDSGLDASGLDHAGLDDGDPLDGDDAGLPPHQFGGVLILEDDPQLRELIAHEIGRTGRKMVSCVDGASARSLLERTPERFELAIIENDARIESGTKIALLAAERSPGIKILLLTSDRELDAELAGHRDVRRVVKPFGVDELREAFRELIGTAVPDRVHR